MVQIIKSENEYYIFDGYDYYGSFYSIAEAETNKRTYRNTPRLKMTKAPTNPVFIVNP